MRSLLEGKAGFLKNSPHVFLEFTQLIHRTDPAPGYFNSTKKREKPEQGEVGGLPSKPAKAKSPEVTVWGPICQEPLRQTVADSLLGTRLSIIWVHWVLITTL